MSAAHLLEFVGIPDRVTKMVARKVWEVERGTSAFITRLVPPEQICMRPEKQNPALPDGKWECVCCNQTGLIPCGCYSGRHSHRCECCKGEGIHDL